MSLDLNDLDTLNAIVDFAKRVGIPAEVFGLYDKNDYAAGFRVYSPAFSGNPNEKDRLKIMGGVGMNLRLSLIPLIEDADFDFQIPIRKCFEVQSFDDGLLSRTQPSLVGIQKHLERTSISGKPNRAMHSDACKF